MLKSIDFYKKYGAPNINGHFLQLCIIPKSLHFYPLPKKILCNIDFFDPFIFAICEITKYKLNKYIKTWDGCTNIRPIRGKEDKYFKLIDSGDRNEAMKLMSVHSWGCAFDINAFENRLGQKDFKLNKDLADIIIGCGFDWGGLWKNPDAMHFQLKNI